MSGLGLGLSVAPMLGLGLMVRVECCTNVRVRVAPMSGLGTRVRVRVEGCTNVKTEDCTNVREHYLSWWMECEVSATVQPKSRAGTL